MEIERQILRAHNLPSDVITTLQAARRDSTNRIYNSTWLSFCRWCTRRGLAAVEASVEQVLEFLQNGLNSGLAPNKLRRQVSALSTILSCGSSLPLTRRPLIRQFLRGAANLRPPALHRYPSWDLPKVLSALTRPPFEPLREVGLHYLSYKVSFLVAITSAHRISELAALSARPNLCIFHTDQMVLRLDPSFIPKINSKFHRAQELILPNFCPSPSHRLEWTWHTLDVRRALRIYLKRTSSFRQSESLFISFQPSTLGLRVSSPIVGRWLRATIAAAYEAHSLPVPGRIMAHSTWSTATSAAWSTQASLEDICRVAMWASPSLFIRHYKLDVYALAEVAFGWRVLQHVIRGEVTSDRTDPTL